MPLAQYKKEIFVIALLFVLVFIAYLPELPHIFILDDYGLVIASRIRSIGHIQDSFTDPIIDQHAHYRPLSRVVRTVLYSFFRDSAYFNRVFNLVLYVVTCWVFFIMLKMMTREYSLSFLTILLFCLHPINGFLIHYITAHEITFFGLFMALSVIFFVLYLERKKRSYYGLSLIFFGVALLFQETTVIFPLFLLLVGVVKYYQFYRLKDIVFICAPFFFLSFVFLSLKALLSTVPSHLMVNIQFLNISLLNYLPTLASLLSWYFQKLIFPHDLIFVWGSPAISDHLALRYLGITIVGGFLLWLLCVRWGLGVKLLALTWFLLGFIPLGVATFIMPNLGMIIEPHWFFFSSLGFFLLMAIYLEKWRAHFAKTFIIFFIFLLIFFMVEIKAYSQIWKNEKFFCQYWLRLSPRNPVPMMRLAVLTADEKPYTEAIRDFENILKFTDGHYEPHKIYYNIGLIYNNIQKFDLAKQNILRAIGIKPSYALAYNALATIYVQERNFKQAEMNFLHAIGVDAHLTTAKLNLSDLYSLRGETEKAIQWYERILKDDPYNPEREVLWLKLAIEYFKQQKFKNSIVYLKLLLKEYPKNKEAYLLYGIVMGNDDYFEEAIQLWQKGSMLDPTDQRFRDNIQRARDLISRKGMNQKN